MRHGQSMTIAWEIFYHYRIHLFVLISVLIPLWDISFLRCRRYLPHWYFAGILASAYKHRCVHLSVCWIALKKCRRAEPTLVWWIRLSGHTAMEYAVSEQLHDFHSQWVVRTAFFTNSIFHGVRKRESSFGQKPFQIGMPWFSTFGAYCFSLDLDKESWAGTLLRWTHNISRLKWFIQGHTHNYLFSFGKAG